MNDAPRVLVVAEGVDRSEAAIFAGLQQSGLRLTVFHEPAVNPASQATLAAAGIPSMEFRVRHRLDSAATQTLRAFLQAHPQDLVYAPINRTLAVALRATRGSSLPVVAYRGTTGHLSRWDPASWLTYFNPRLAHIVCVSDAVRRHLVEDLRIPAKRVTRIWKGHDPDWYRSMPVETAWPEGSGFTVGFAGRIRPVKGVDVLLDSLRWIPEETPLRMVLIGRVDDSKVVRRLRRPEVACRVVALGPCRDAAVLLGRCDVAVMPSVGREGFPRAVVEAMAQGVPVVVSAVGGLPEMVVDGESGWVVPPRDPRALAAALVKLKDNVELRRRLGRAARTRVEACFHVRFSIEAFAKLFRSLALPPG